MQVARVHLCNGIHHISVAPGLEESGCAPAADTARFCNLPAPHCATTPPAGITKSPCYWHHTAQGTAVLPTWVRLGTKPAYAGDVVIRENTGQHCGLLKWNTKMPSSALLKATLYKYFLLFLEQFQFAMDHSIV